MENNTNSTVSTESKVYTAEEVAAILGVFQDLLHIEKLNVLMLN